MPTYPRTIMPTRVGVPVFAGPLLSVGQSGKLNLRSTVAVGRVWVERYFFKADEDGREFLAQLANYYRNGTILDVAHPQYTLLGAGGGTPKVAGGAQTGQSITTDGWPTSTLVLKAGDLVKFAGVNLVYDNTVDVTSDGSGNATLVVNPPVFSGGSPADNADITVTDAVTFRSIIAALEIPEHGPDQFVAVSVTFREAP